MQEEGHSGVGSTEGVVDAITRATGDAEISDAMSGRSPGVPPAVVTTAGLFAALQVARASDVRKARMARAKSGRLPTYYGILGEANRQLYLSGQRFEFTPDEKSAYALMRKGVKGGKRKKAAPKKKAAAKKRAPRKK